MSAFKTRKSGIKADVFTLKVHRALRAAGYNPGRENGMMDPRTTAAIRQFQLDNNLCETGVVDCDTFISLRRHLN